MKEGECATVVKTGDLETSVMREEVSKLLRE